MADTRLTTALECVECGAALSYRGTGRRPRYCSQTCRNRAYETRRAARTGAVATRVVERVVEVEARLNVDAVVRWLDGHPRRLSAVLRGMEWTREQQDGLRYGLEGAVANFRRRAVTTQSSSSDARCGSAFSGSLEHPADDHRVWVRVPVGKHRALAFP
mgnify:CR=1 FL=1